MTIEEVLEADWTVDKIIITVRSAATSIFLREYHIGEDLKPCKYHKFVRETKAGTLYEDAGKEHLYMERLVQYRHLPRKPKGKEGCVGVLTENIPKELLELQVRHMSPYGCGRSDGMHGYRFECYAGMWFGVPGENEAM